MTGVKARAREDAGLKPGATLNSRRRAAWKATLRKNRREILRYAQNDRRKGKGTRRCRAEARRYIEFAEKSRLEGGATKKSKRDSSLRSE